ncbi:MAG: hypothetical protein OXC07_00640 [Kistimonas sp.]|nr:hypothetical protein [Kistimonas sp.]
MVAMLRGKPIFSRRTLPAPLPQAVRDGNGGKKTEPEYFALFLDQTDQTIKIKCLPDCSQSAPPPVLKPMEDYLRDESLKSRDEAWLVVAKDE